MKPGTTQRSSLEDLIFALTDGENQPHQFVNDAEGLAIAILQTGITGETDPEICPHWGEKPSNHFGPCDACLNCLVREGAFERIEA